MKHFIWLIVTGIVLAAVITVWGWRLPTGTSLHLAAMVAGCVAIVMLSIQLWLEICRLLGIGGRFQNMVRLRPVLVVGFVALLATAVIDWRQDALSHAEPAEVIQVDLGDHSPGALIEKSLSIPNETSLQLTIGQVDKSCACVSYEFSARSIMPRGKGDLRFRYTAPDALGPFQQELVVYYGGEQRKTVVRMAGTVANWAEVEPERIVLPEVAAGDRVETSCRVRIRSSTG